MDPTTKRNTSVVALLLVASSVLCAQSKTGANTPRWIASTASHPWQEMPVEASPAAPEPSTTPIRVDRGQVFQQIDGFGSCFNELGWEALLALDEPARAKVLHDLFAPDAGNFTLGRVPIGANDFSLSWYSMDDTPGDYELKDFSIQRDRTTLLPFLHAAMKYQPKLAVWAVPWSPPTWMKTNSDYKGGAMKDDPKTLSSYALYFSKFVQAYRKEGIRLYAIMPQNEPKYNDNNYPQAVWTAELIHVFLRDYLAPRLQSDKVPIELWLGTMVSKDLAEYVEPSLDDPGTNRLITGVAYQWAGRDAFLATHTRYPDKKLMQSEAECADGANNWVEGLGTFDKIIDDLNRFAGSYFYWNTVLNDEGKSHWGWHQNSLVTVDRATRTAHYNPEFYSMNHFSSYVLPGAHRIAVSGGPFQRIAAFRNPSGADVLEFANDGNAPVETTIENHGVSYHLLVAPQSMNTFLLPAKP